VAHVAGPCQRQSLEPGLVPGGIGPAQSPLDAVLFWNVRDLERKLEAIKIYDNDYRVHQGLDANTPG